MTTVDEARRAIENLEDDAVIIGFDHDAIDRTEKTGPLAGEAIVVKDCIAVPDHPTTGGSPQLATHKLAPGGAVTRLLDAGAVIVATASMHELAFGITGFNQWRGTAVNPSAPERLPGGSSSASAVAVARGIVDVALGTDTGGSCRIPAACCGVVGFRPSTGRYPSDGLLTLSQTRDTIGLLATSIEGVARFDRVLSGDPGGAEDDEPSRVSRLGVVGSDVLDACDEAVRLAYWRWVAAAAGQGIEPVEIDLDPLFDMDEEAGFIVAHSETIANYRRLCEARGVHYDEFVAGLANDDVRGLMALEPPTEEARQDALKRVVPAMQEWYEQTLAEVDLLAMPTIPALPPMRSELDEMMLNGAMVQTFQTMIRFTSPATLSGVPSLSVPIAGAQDGTAAGPVSVMLEGRRNSDASLLGSARWLADRVDGMG